MLNYINYINLLEMQINTYFIENTSNEKILFLDGVGMLSSYQNTALKLIGHERHSLFKEIHIVSGSSYALFIYLALLDGEFLWDKHDIHLWNSQVRKWHGVVPIYSFLKFISYKYFKIPAGNFGGHYTACNSIFSKKFLNRKLSSFSGRYNFWTYNKSTGKICVLNGDNEYKNLTVPDIISMTSCFPAIFGSHWYQNEEYIDAICAPNFNSSKYSRFKGSVLHLNMLKNDIRNNFYSLKIHEHASGNKHMVNDFFKFLLGIKNLKFDYVTKYALYGDQ